MSEASLHRLGVVLVSWAVIYLLRALPFALMWGLDMGERPWVRTVERWLSPAVIALLVVYSYTGLEWRTAWPYLAGAVVVGLQLWRRSGLLSILIGTALYMVLIRL